MFEYTYVVFCLVLGEIYIVMLKIICAYPLQGVS